MMNDSITKQDRDDAIANLIATFSRFQFEVDVLEILDHHRVNYADSKNLGYYRTFVECSCGAGWWYGEHSGDPIAEDRWMAHRVVILHEALSTVRDAANV